MVESRDWTKSIPIRCFPIIVLLSLCRNRILISNSVSNCFVFLWWILTMTSVAKKQVASIFWCSLYSKKTKNNNDYLFIIPSCVTRRLQSNPIKTLQIPEILYNVKIPLAAEIIKDFSRTLMILKQLSLIVYFGFAWSFYFSIFFSNCLTNFIFSWRKCLEKMKKGYSRIQNSGVLTQRWKALNFLVEKHLISPISWKFAHVFFFWPVGNLSFNNGQTLWSWSWSGTKHENIAPWTTIN